MQSTDMEVALFSPAWHVCHYLSFWASRIALAPVLVYRVTLSKRTGEPCIHWVECNLASHVTIGVHASQLVRVVHRCL